MSAIGTNIVIEAAVRLGTLIDSHARDAGRQLGEWLHPWLRSGEALPDFTLVLRLPARMIRHAGQRLRERQSELDEVRSHEGEALFQRNQTTAALRRKLVEIRRLLTPVFGAHRTGKLLGFAGKTALASQPKRLLSQADAFLKALRDPKRPAIPETAYFDFDPSAAAAELEPLLVACREAHSRLDETRQTCAARLEAKDRVRAELHHAVQCVVCIVGGWFLLIRRLDLAQKLRLVRRGGRPTRRRSGCA